MSGVSGCGVVSFFECILKSGLAECESLFFHTDLGRSLLSRPGSFDGTGASSGARLLRVACETALVRLVF